MLSRKKKKKLKKKSRKYKMKNIYGKTLQPCKISENDNSGSWDPEGYCSELGGGVHQICFKLDNSTKNFSKDTYQSNWSNERINKNHCMCLGAWSLYKARQSKNEIPETNNELKCDAIPEIALTSNYINKWNRWNGHELPNQIVNGINSLVNQCIKTDDEKSKKYLLARVNKLKKEYPKIFN
jgi:hypothetical protein